jgi:hypothetical protein
VFSVSQVKTISSNVLLSSELLSAEDSFNLSIELRERVELTASEVIGMDLPARNRVEALLQKEFLEEDQLRGLSFDFAEHILHVFEWYCPDDPRPRNFLKIAKLYYAGRTSNERLKFAFIETWRSIERLNENNCKGAFVSGLAISLLYSGEAGKMARDVALTAQNAAHRKQWENRRNNFEPMTRKEREAVWQLKRIVERLA